MFAASGGEDFSGGLAKKELAKLDDLVKSLLERHPGESRGPDVVPTKVGNHLIDWIPVFTGNPGFRLSPE
ncbi:MAG: hypothetical protein NTV04_20395 [Deltaproteobacteria bacterium]|nr:hypothetical protein [Deltaproteobacteria bacterium]